jgi:hypothetical protein
MIIKVQALPPNNIASYNVTVYYDGGKEVLASTADDLLVDDEPLLLDPEEVLVVEAEKVLVLPRKYVMVYTRKKTVM